MDYRSLIPRNEAIRQLGISRATFDRWRRCGLRGVRLNWIAFGGRVCVTQEDLDRFMEELKAQRKPGKPVPQRKRSDVMKEHREAMKRLREVHGLNV